MIRNLYTSIGPLLMGLISLSGCETLRNEVDPDRFDSEASRLVVTCFLSPQDLVLAAKVTRTKPILSTPQGASGDNVSDAIVRLADGKQSVLLRYDAKQGFYKADVKQLPIVAGHTYVLAVQTPAHEQATSVCTVPGPVNLAGMLFDSLTDWESGHPFQRYFVRARWQDPVAQTNYYQITGLFRYVRNAPVSGRSAAYQIREEATYLQFDRREDSFVNDQMNRGSTMLSEPAYLTSSSADSTLKEGFRNQYATATVVINLLNTDRAYYQYQDAIIRQAETKGNPFAEPVPLPNNIQGGLGCFGAYNRSTLMVRLR